jgi:hypothetical protein
VDHLALLRFGENAFDQLDLNQWHECLLDKQGPEPIVSSGSVPEPAQAEACGYRSQAKACGYRNHASVGAGFSLRGGFTLREGFGD